MVTTSPGYPHPTFQSSSSEIPKFFSMYSQVLNSWSQWYFAIIDAAETDLNNESAFEVTVNLIVFAGNLAWKWFYS